MWKFSTIKIIIPIHFLRKQQKYKLKTAFSVLVITLGIHNKEYILELYT